MGTDAAYKKDVVTRSVVDLTDAFRFGIEEEYFLVDAHTKAIAPTVPQALFAAAKTLTLGRLRQHIENEPRLRTK